MCMKNFEITEAGLFDSRLKFPVNEGFITPLRKVLEYEIELFTEETVTTFLNHTKYDIKKGHILVSKPDQMRQSKLHFKVHYVHLNVFDREIKNILENLPDVFPISSQNDYITIFEKLSKAEQSDFSGKELYINSLLYRLLFMIKTDAESTERVYVSYNKDLLESGAEFIKNHYQEQLTLSKISETVNLSPVYFHKLFKAHTGKTPLEYLKEIRLNQAIYMLSTSNKSISEIALSCGFTSQSYFNAFFKKELSTTPLKYRKSALDKYGI